MRLLNEDECQLILKNNNLGCDHKREQSPVEKTRVKNNEDTNNNQNSMPNTKGSIQLIDLENTSQEHNSLVNNSHTLLNSNTKDRTNSGKVWFRWTNPA